MTSDPDEAYEVRPIPDGEFMAASGWWQCEHNGVPLWFGPRERMEQLATDPAARADARKSRMHHDRTGTKFPP